jgi:hypothetical protein
VRTAVTKLGPEAAEGLAVRALAYLAADAERLRVFLDASGIEASAIRAAAREPRFLAGVLEHIASDERLLLGFAGKLDCDPSLIGRAQAALSGAAPRHDVP